VRVLVADDERVLADMVAEGLRRLAMAVDVVYDGDSALERLDVNRYDVAVLDRDMPGHTGDEVCKRITESPADTRVLLLTAAGGIRDRVEGLGLGADDYLTKPSPSPSWWPECRRYPGGHRRRCRRCSSRTAWCWTPCGTPRRATG
jgi:DNA-binding response OmpR family regulator